MITDLLAAPAWRDDAAVLKESPVLDHLLSQTGVYDKSRSGKPPNFVIDPAWPRPLRR